jgi:hypothetical protein|tara:strand:+ start:1604 stop:2248 length:645 start_codon:yes stop_codon:yes gene_type:complete
MPLTVANLQNRFQSQIAPGDDTEFYRILSEADERLLESGRWHWTREKLELTVDTVTQYVELPDGYSAIVACRLDEVPIGVRWEESEYYEEGVGEIPIDGCRYRIVDQGVIDGARTFKVVGENIETVFVLAKIESAGEIDDPSDELICPSATALKLMCLGIVYEEANDIDRSQAYEGNSLRKLKDYEDSYRGIAREIFSPTQYNKLPRRARVNIP